MRGQSVVIESVLPSLVALAQCGAAASAVAQHLHPTAEGHQFRSSKPRNGSREARISSGGRHTPVRHVADPTTAAEQSPHCLAMPTGRDRNARSAPVTPQPPHQPGVAGRGIQPVAVRPQPDAAPVPKPASRAITMSALRSAAPSLVTMP